MDDSAPLGVATTSFCWRIPDFSDRDEEESIIKTLGISLDFELGKDKDGSPLKWEIVFLKSWDGKRYGVFLIPESKTVGDPALYEPFAFIITLGNKDGLLSFMAGNTASDAEPFDHMLKKNWVRCVTFDAKYVNCMLTPYNALIIEAEMDVPSFTTQN